MKKSIVMKRIIIRENSWIAKLIAKRLKFSRIAVVLGETIHLHNASVETFINTKRWVIHELTHIEQYHREGKFNFLLQYGWELIRKGYYNNKFEIEARNSERNESLLFKYDLSDYKK